MLFYRRRQKKIRNYTRPKPAWLPAVSFHHE